MAIQLPTLKRIDPSAPAAAPQIQAQIPSGAKDLAQGQADLHGLAEQGIKYQNQMADQQADTTSTNAMNEFEQWHKARIDGDPGDENHPAIIGLKYQQGDPQENFRNFEKEADEKLKQLSQSRDPDGPWSQETQNLVNRRLGRKAEELRMTALTTYGAEKHKYDDSMTEDRVKLDQNGMADATTHIDPVAIQKGDMSSLDFIKERKTSIVAARVQQGLRYGGVTIDDKNGEVPYTDPATGEKHFVTLGPQTDIKIRQDLSKAFYDATENLVKSGEDDPGILAKAKVMKEQFGQYIEPLKQGGLNEAFGKAKIKNQANDLVAQAEGKTPDQAEKIFAGADNQETKTKARQLYSDNLRYQESARKNQQELNYRSLFKTAMQLKQSDPSMTESQFESTAQYKHAADKLDPKDLPSLKAVFNPPKENDANAIARVEKILGGGVEGMDPKTMTGDEVNRALVGLNGTTRDSYMKRFETGTSDPKKFSMNAHAMTQLKQQLVETGQIHPDPLSNKLDNEDERRLGAYSRELSQKLDPILNTLSPSDMANEVQKFAVSKGQKQDYTAPTRQFRAFGPQFGGTAPIAGPSKKVKVQLTPDQIRGKAINDFTAEKGKPPVGKELQNYINENSERYK